MCFSTFPYVSPAVFHLVREQHFTRFYPAPSLVFVERFIRLSRDGCVYLLYALSGPMSGTSGHLVSNLFPGAACPAASHRWLSRLSPSAAFLLVISRS